MADARAALPDGLPTAVDQVQVFGRRDSRDTQKALRFFRERRISVVFADIAARPMAPAELRRFSDRLKPRALLDEQSRAYVEAGLAYLRLDDADLFDRLLSNQRLLRLPLVRAGRELSAGVDESAWKRWLSAASQ